MPWLLRVVASIPSPSSKSIHVGPLQVRFYGLMIALGVLAAVWLAQKRWVERGGHADDIAAVAMWAVPAGLVGARLYHVMTDWRSFQGRWGDVVKIWQGGLGIPGGMLAGVLVGLWAARRRGLSVPDALDACVPALPFAQAVGRFGNYFNQELFGRPSSLPWAVRIDARYRPVQYASSSTFHPTFLYEAVWNVALCLVLVAVDRRRIVRRGRLVGVYMVGYGLGRLWVESLRIDPASRLAGLRVNIWVSLVVVAAGLALLVTGPRRAGDTAAHDGEPEGAVPDDAATADDGTADHAATATPDDAGDTAEHERG